MPETPLATALTIGEVADRTGISRSALRFYESEDLVDAGRTDGGQRRYHRGVLRRLAFIRSAQTVGLELDDIRAALEALPEQRTPTKADWARLSRGWRPLLDQRISELIRLRDQLDQCIGCGCLSLRSCGLYNPEDRAAAFGKGARYLISDERPSGIGR